VRNQPDHVVEIATDDDVIPVVQVNADTSEKLACDVVYQESDGKLYDNQRVELGRGKAIWYDNVRKDL